MYNQIPVSAYSSPLKKVFVLSGEYIVEPPSAEVLDQFRLEWVSVLIHELPWSPEVLQDISSLLAILTFFKNEFPMTAKQKKVRLYFVYLIRTFIAPMVNAGKQKEAMKLAQKQLLASSQNFQSFSEWSKTSENL